MVHIGWTLFHEAHFWPHIAAEADRASLCKLIVKIYLIYLKIEDRFPGFTTRDYINLEKLKQYIQYQWIERTCPKFLSVFGTKISTTNGPERFNKKLNSSVGGSKPNFWKFLDVMNKVLDY